jgi:hypothetical protein
MTIYNKDYYKDYSKEELIAEIVRQNFLIDDLIVQRHRLKDKTDIQTAQVINQQKKTLSFIKKIAGE